LSAVRLDVEPRWAFRLPGGTRDGLLRRGRDGTLRRLLHVDGVPVVVTAAQPAAWRVRLVADARAEDGPRGRAAAAHALERLRFALGVDDDLAPFHARFRDDPLLGRVLRAYPALRVRRRPEPWEALLAAVTEQLIDTERALAIQRRLIARFGRARAGLRDAPSAAAIAAAAPAELAACGLAPQRALTLRRAARVDLHAAPVEAGWRRLRAIPGIGAWTVEMLALHGQGRLDELPAGDLHFLKLVGRLTSGGDPRARAGEDDVRALFAPYAPWRGLAGVYALHGAARGLLSPPAPRSRPGRAPRRAGTRSSAPGRRWAAA